jgi:hypothetical protein
MIHHVIWTSFHFHTTMAKCGSSGGALHHRDLLFVDELPDQMLDGGVEARRSDKAVVEQIGFAEPDFLDYRPGEGGERGCPAGNLSDSPSR